MRLWDVRTGRCLFVWDFPTAVKAVAFSEDERQIVCLTEQRMGHQSAIRIFDVNREEGTERAWSSLLFLSSSDHADFCGLRLGWVCLMIWHGLG